jgi:hypothetical protein
MPNDIAQFTFTSTSFVVHGPFETYIYELTQQ